MVVICYGLLLPLYRIFLHPLAKLPGPKLAAATYWYDLYHDWFAGPCFGRSAFNIEQLHAIYGPVVRITPDEISVKDPDWYDALFSGRYEKCLRNYHAMGSPGSIAQASDPELHRLRRAPLNAFFSKRSILNLESIVKHNVELLSEGFDSFLQRRQPLHVGTALTALGIDVITDYAFGQSWGCLQDANFSPSWKATMMFLLRAVPILKHIHWLFRPLNKLAETRLTSLNPNLVSYSGFRKHVHAQIKRLLDDRSVAPQKREVTSQSRTVFEAVLDSDLPSDQKTLQRVADEALVMVVAGGETTAASVTSLLFHLLDNPTVLRQVQVELDTVMPDPAVLADWTTLEKLPHLHAAIKETLRISSLITTRQQMVLRDGVWTYGTWIIPVGTTISMSIPATHLDASIFPSPNTFLPERWMGEHAKGLEKYFIPFSKGSRACIGQNLAYCEMYLASAAILRRFDMELFDTVRERDIDVVRDCLVGMPGYASKGVRVRILGRRE
ncbi:Isotrichodermin C-15 hydroxylase [Sphaceloma murrayae]|uniref:Isotrichodermin C-15 hydroxylase n=1 Tax=Sphaceloma murrayae TaxID=2082308 RepID=A0A2K1QPP3_9PEZI|nr:Isotrichodermin C-15 hydroxylase [Sphaceloma murrayae]